MKSGVLGLLLILVFLGGVPSRLLAQLDLQYQSRSQEQLGSWKEGVKPKPVSGLNVELISVLADYQELVSSENFPNAVKLQFYLDDKHAVYLTVRELDYRTYYWLDKVEPARVWEKGFQNVFAWPTDPVLQQLTPKLGLYELGALVRLDAESTSSIERVAPAVLYHKDAPSMIEGYFFTLKTGEDARLLASITQHATGKEVERQIFRRKRAGLPFTIHWDAEDAEPGPYKLDISGFSLSTNQPLSKEIHFYHQPILNP
ncbi:MAG: hypothetical protein KC592_13295 [Nitrospira sp.]|nr:hypothetical protein [Nitrospira sp.]HNP28274.1 hypothetical protein [Nitrospirales bacterium]